MLYRGVPCELSVTSVLEEYNCRIEALIRTAAVDNGLVDALWSENDLIGQRPNTGTKIEAALLQKCELARKSLADSLDHSEATAENIKLTMAQKFSFLMSCDRWFKIEQSFWMGSMGAPGTERMKALILECLPGPADKWSLEQCDARLKHLAGSRLLHFCGSSMQAIFSSIHGFVSTMLQGKSPNLQVVSDSLFTLQIKERLSRFCVFELSSGSAAAPEVYIGKQALTKHWCELKKKFAAKIDLALTDVKTLHMFSWMLSGVELAELKSMTHSIVAFQAKQLTESGLKEGAKKSAAKKNADTAKALASSLFL